jgi:uncharacterized protein (TIGR02145 family)
MNKPYFIIKSLLFICITINSCIPNPEKETRRKNEDYTKNEKVVNVAVNWVDCTHGYITDIRDDKRYWVVRIGTQVWFAENLAYKPARGDYWSYDELISNVSKYGYLYFWETANSACPTGWHVPSVEEWNSLLNYLGGKTIAGGKLKTVNGWNGPDAKATDIYGFSALPAGNRAIGGSFYHLGDDALFWSGTSQSNKSALKIRLSHNWDSVGIEACGRLTGLSVRCIQDQQFVK